MKILAFDTSNTAMSVALMADSQLLAETTINRKKTHSERLLPTIQQLLEDTGWQVEDVDRVVVADGPGSYTGVRIAVTTAKTLADTLEKELVGVSSLAVMAANVQATNALIVPLMDARRYNVFAGVYQWVNGDLVNVVADRHVALATLLEEVRVLRQPAVFVGDVTVFQEDIKATLGAVAQFLTGADALPRASRLASLGAKLQPVAPAGFVPRYLRLTEAETNWLKTHDATRHEPYVQKV